MSFVNAEWIRPRAWGAAFGAVAMIAIGFWGLGWSTHGTAEQLAKTQSDAAVVTALVPFCVAKAERDPDAARLTKLRGEASGWDRAQVVRDSGWATMTATGASPDYALAEACSEKLKTL
jgi:hypothetical protein